MTPRAVPHDRADGQRTWLLHGPRLDVAGGTVWTAIEASLRARPEAARVRWRGRSLTGAALLLGLAQFERLPQRRRIGVHVARSAAMVQAVLAIWSRGSSYVPLATDLPPARLAAMVEGCEPAAIVTDGDPGAFPRYVVVSSLRVFDGALFILLPAAVGEASGAGQPAPDTAVPQEASCCYVAHTSGTTGTPKGALIPHRALLNRIGAMRQLLAPGEADAILFKASLAFDVHVWEFVLPLVAGCLLVIYPQDRLFDLRDVADLLVAERITIAGFVPSLLKALLDRPDFVASNRLRAMFCGGENWAPALAARFRERLPSCTLRNSYGPAETTLAVANWPVPPDATRIELGAPMANTIFMIEEIASQDDVVTGVLCIGGAQVAEGYIARSCPDPFFTCAVDGVPTAFYRSGDLVELDRRCGALTFRGRVDHQVKLNGVRAELEEVEAAILTLQDIETCVVLVVSRNEERCLLATFKTVGNVALDASHLRRRCRELLPVTHVPAAFRQLDAYRWTINGKIDRAWVQAAVASPAGPASGASR